jgi:hypothetical protein
MLFLAQKQKSQLGLGQKMNHNLNGLSRLQKQTNEFQLNQNVKKMCAF